MIDKIKGALGRLQIEHWRINRNHTETAELFFIRRGADMRRAADYTEAQVTVYRDFEADGKNMRGSALVNVYPGMEDDALDKALAEAYAAAGHVKNAFYELPDPVVERIDAQQESESLFESAKRMADALFSADNLGSAFINSAEIFAEKSELRVVASNGLDVSYARRAYKGEFVTQCTEPQDVEIYTDFSYTEPDCEALRKEAEQALKTVQDRAGAKENPKAGSYDCVLSGQQVARLLSSYAMKANASMVFSRYSRYAVGSSVQGEEISGEKLNIRLTSPVPYSEEGVAMPGVALTEDGVLRNLHGENRFCRYLGIEPAGTYASVQVDNGTLPMAELLKAPCIHPVEFSDFQMNPLSGYFGGEIRLAYVYDENGVHTVTGGSVSGSLLEMQGDMVFSTERYVNSRYDGPMAVKLKNVSVAGAE
ncbi:MAG: metallopeptidase TldD-related protein [Eubacteriales bacterium]|nr:metallopeptidase TldD-related protein [Eubacteriales bacterium]